MDLEHLPALILNISATSLIPPPDQLDTIKSGSHQGYIFNFGDKLYLALEFPQAGNKRLGILFSQLKSDMFSSHISAAGGEQSGCYIIGFRNDLYAYTGNINDTHNILSSLPEYSTEESGSWSDSRYSYIISPVLNTSLRILNADSNTSTNTAKQLISLLFPVTLMVIADFIFLFFLLNVRFIQPMHRLSRTIAEIAKPSEQKVSTDTDISTGSYYVDSEDASSGVPTAATDGLTEIESSISALIDTHKKQDAVLETVTDELIDRLLSDLLSNKHLSSGYYADRLSSMHAQLDTDGIYLITILRPDNSASEASARLLDNLKASLKTEPSSFGSKYCHICSIYNSQLIILTEFPVHISPAELSSYISGLQSAADSFFHTAGTYYDLKHSELYADICDTGYIYDALLHNSSTEQKLYGPAYFSEKLGFASDMIKSGNTAGAENFLNTCINDALNLSEDELARQNIINNYLIGISGMFRFDLDIADGLNKENIALSEDSSCLTDDTVHYVADKSSPEDIIGEISGINRQLCRKLNDYYAKRKNKYVAASVDYIAAHYQESDLSLEKTADALGVHFNYLSRVFKANMEENFTIYVNRYRIEQAKQLLSNSGLKINEISAMTGFGSQQNFTKVFKKYEQLTPGRYREMHSADC